ncbi:MAG: metalloregulator ArsR/SmtB family transcription factor [Candidatus Omnitrophica bacterium]|nr:metalloregulator ArsR/SmtB family transcription factor [Candidatus Omnitrophota bacterium]
MRDFEKVLKACADKNRIRILKLLEKRRLCVCEIAFVLGITQPSVSRHLRKLKKAALIETEQDSFWTNYFLKPGNKYAKAIASSMKQWLNDDNIVKQDLVKVKKANREKLCCAK